MENFLAAETEEVPAPYQASTVSCAGCASDRRVGGEVVGLLSNCDMSIMLSVEYLRRQWAWHGRCWWTFVCFWFRRMRSLLAEAVGDGW